MENSAGIGVQKGKEQKEQELVFPFAEQADIIRASQKDEFYKHALSTNFFDVVRQMLGPGSAMQWKEELQVFSDMIYYVLTTLRGRQSLGEEYCDVMQVQGDRLTPLVSWERLSLVLVMVLVPFGFNKLIHKLTALSRPQFQYSLPPHLQQRRTQRWVLPENYRVSLEKYLPQIIAFLNIMGRVHIAVFFFSGVFYEFTKRIMNVRNIFNREYVEERPRYAILGVLIFLQMIISLFIFVKQALRPAKLSQLEENSESVDLQIQQLVSSTNRCSLCMDIRKNPTSTSCGHLFCWECIVEWCNNKSECPFCRTPQKMNDLMCVYGI